MHPATAARAATDYAGRRVALLTQHGKERVVAPVLRDAVGCFVERVDGYDTDRLGTFTREVPREGTQLDAARRKARIGMDLSGLPLGVASEGSFGADPVAGMLVWNREVVLWRDDERDLEVIGFAQGPGAFVNLLVDEWQQVVELAEQACFPAHALVVRPDGADGAPIRKGIVDWPELQDAFARAQRQSPQRLVFVETDVRAHVNPTRMRMIERATRDLAERLGRRCPTCAMPGYGAVATVAGLCCRECGAPTAEPRADVFACPACDHRVTLERPAASGADPTFCERCNP